MHTFVAEGGSCFGFEFTIDASDLGATGREHDGAGKLATQVGIEDAESGQCAGGRWDEDASDIEGSQPVHRRGADQRRRMQAG